MTEDAARALSFGAIAREYDRLRPPPPDEAVEWLVPPECATAVDVGAGTGLFTRALALRVPHVIAVEPDPRMREVLAERSPGVRLVAAPAEEMPLPDAIADAIVVSSAWHWMAADQALAEIARVLRPGGRFGAIWTGRDRQVEWLRELDAVVEPDRAALDAVARHHEVTLPPGSLFVDPQKVTFRFERTMHVEDLAAMFATYSGAIVSAAEARAQRLAAVRSMLAARFPGRTMLEVPMRSSCWRATRTLDGPAAVHAGV